jgi:hypothetical protein
VKVVQIVTFSRGQEGNMWPVIVFFIMTIQTQGIVLQNGGREKKIPLWDSSIHTLGQIFF